MAIFFKREVDKVGLISMNITMHIIQGSGTCPADPVTARPTFDFTRNAGVAL